MKYTKENLFIDFFLDTQRQSWIIDPTLETSSSAGGFNPTNTNEFGHQPYEPGNDK